jgi:hypothetical protein
VWHAVPGAGFGSSERAAFFDCIALLKSLKVLRMAVWEEYVGDDALVVKVLRNMPCLEVIYVHKFTPDKTFAKQLPLQDDPNWV